MAVSMAAVNMAEAMLKAQNQQFEMMTFFVNAFLQQSQGQKADDNHIA